MHEKAKYGLGGFKKALRPLSAEVPKSDSETCLGRYGSEFGGPSGCNSDFRAVTLTFGAKPESCHRNIAPESFHRSSYSKAFFRHRVNGVGRGGGQTVLDQILTRFHAIRLKSG